MAGRVYCSNTGTSSRLARDCQVYALFDQIHLTIVALGGGAYALDNRLNKKQ